MRTLVLLTLAVFGLTSASAAAADGNRFVKGTKSYQKSLPSSDEKTESVDVQASAAAENPQDISPAAGAEEDSRPSTKDIMVESMKLPRK